MKELVIASIVTMFLWGLMALNENKIRCGIISDILSVFYVFSTFAVIAFFLIACNNQVMTWGKGILFYILHVIQYFGCIAFGTVRGGDFYHPAVVQSRLVSMRHVPGIPIVMGFCFLIMHFVL